MTVILKSFLDYVYAEETQIHQVGGNARLSSPTRRHGIT